MRKSLLALAIFLSACISFREPPTPAPLSLAPAFPKMAPWVVASPVWIEDSVKAELAKAWNSAEFPQYERGYCVRYLTSEYGPGIPQFTVVQIAKGMTEWSTPNSVLFHCPTGKGFTTLHIHPPHSCDDNDVCTPGGYEANECFPSSNDWNIMLNDRDADFALIQCGPDEITPYFRVPYWHPIMWNEPQGK